METTTETPEPLPVSAKFSAAMARWVSACMAEQDIRYYLNGVYCEPAPDGGVFIVATDGIRMMAAYDKDGTANQPFIFQFSRAAITACDKRLAPPPSKSTAPATHITVEGTRLMVTSAIGDEKFIQPGKCIIEGHFPDWKRVAPPRDRSELTAGGDASLNFNYLASFTKQLPKVSLWSNEVGVMLWRKKSCDANPEDSAVFLEFIGLPILGVLMPRREESGKHFWLDAPKDGVVEHHPD